MQLTDVSYVIRKHYHSVLLQGICDVNRKFVDVFAGVCGSVHDARYDLLPPYRDSGHLTPTQRHYNIIHSKTCVGIEGAFRLLKGRFGRLKYLYIQHIQYAPLSIVACCVLHNICLDSEDELNDLL
ncbi:uncharacterized protein LOC117169794 [Belonocnema kinseyi]|uniref:uncharacterized protein LOC117169794 n=1 Tax=Belonocnema kinseyi TaxID=2817044 RepID=UPI00143CDF70|nr:uncharacterized protein LOC117169794 [Belonocnema kinseyi]